MGKRRNGSIEFLENFIPTSKVQLKRVCLACCEGDFKKAQEMYEYYSKDINLPDTDPVAPTTLEQVKSNALGFMSFIRDNQNELLQGYNILHYMFTNKGALPMMEAATAPEAELPPINE